MAWRGASQSHRATLEQALRNDPVLAPMFEYSNCIIMGGVPGSDCVFDVAKLGALSSASVGWLASDGHKINERPQEKAVSVLYGDSKYGHLACEEDDSCRLGEKVE